MYAINIDRPYEPHSDSVSGFATFGEALGHLVGELQDSMNEDLESLGGDISESSRKDLIRVWECAMLNLLATKPDVVGKMACPNGCSYSIDKE